MDVQTKQINPAENLQYYLDKACQAEAAGTKVEAERLFRLALRCEELQQPEMSNVTDEASLVAAPVNKNS